MNSFDYNACITQLDISRTLRAQRMLNFCRHITCRKALVRCWRISLLVAFGGVLAVGAIALFKMRPTPTKVVTSHPPIEFYGNELIFTRYEGIFRPQAPGGYDTFITVGPDFMAGVQKQNVSEKIKLHDQRITEQSVLDASKPSVIYNQTAGKQLTMNGVDDLDDPVQPFALSLNTVRYVNDPFGQVFSGNLEFPASPSKLDPSGTSYMMLQMVHSDDLNTPATLWEIPMRLNSKGLPEASGSAVRIKPPPFNRPIVLTDANGQPVASIYKRPHYVDIKSTELLFPEFVLQTVDGEHVVACLTALDSRGNSRFFVGYSHLEHSAACRRAGADGAACERLEPRYGSANSAVGYLGNELYAPGCQWDGQKSINAYVNSRPVLGVSTNIVY